MLEPMTKADHRAALALVERAWTALEDISAGPVSLRTMLERNFRRGELDHRRLHHGMPCAMTVGQATRQQSVRWLAHYLMQPTLPGAGSYLHIRQDVFLAAACVADVGPQIALQCPSHQRHRDPRNRMPPGYARVPRVQRPHPRARPLVRRLRPVAGCGPSACPRVRSNGIPPTQENPPCPPNPHGAT